MAFHAITREKDVEEAQHQFSALLRRDARKYRQCKVGYPGGSENADLFWHPRLKFWYGYKKASNRHWNIFGSSHPELGGCHNILCEINVPYSDRNNAVQGIFARNTAHNSGICVLHQGRLTITGYEDEGHKFLDWVEAHYGRKGTIVQIVWDQGEPAETEAIMVADLDDHQFLRRIKDFIVRALNFKNLKRGVRTLT